MSKSHSSSQQQTQSNQALDPDIKSALLGNYQGIASAVPAYTPYSGQEVAGFTPLQLQGQSLVGDIATNQTGQAALDAAKAAATSASTYTPQQITAPTSSANLVDTSALPTVNGGSLTGVDLSKYMDPYLSGVVGTTANQIDLQRQRDLNTSQQNATLAGAWRGDRQGVADALTNESANNTLASTVAQLESQGYGLATQNAEADLARGLTAQQSNQGTALSAATTNAGAQNATSLANANAALAAATSNQGAGLTAAQLGLTGAQTLAGISGQDLSEAESRANDLQTTGATQQAQNQAALDWAYKNNYLNAQQYAFALQQLKNQSLGLAGDPTLTQSSGSGSGSSTSIALKI